MTIAIAMTKIMMYSVATGKSGRPPRPMLQLAVPANQLEASHGQVILMVKMNMLRLTMFIIHTIIVEIVFFITIIIRILNTTAPFTATSGRTTTL